MLEKLGLSKNPRTDSKSRQLEEEICHMLQSRFDTHAASASNTVHELMEGSDVEQRLMCLSHQRDTLNQILLQVLGATIDNTSTPRTVGTDFTTDNADSQHNQVTEILSISSQESLQSIAALLTRRNGKTISFSSHNNSGHPSYAKLAGNLITYNTDSSTTADSESESRPTIKSYGTTAVSGSGSAHLGDIHFAAPINIHQVVVVDQQQERRNDNDNVPSPVHQTPESGCSNVLGEGQPLFQDESSNRKPAQDLKKIRVRDSSSIVQDIKSALHYDEESYRISTVKEAHRRTFGWILSPSESNREHDFHHWLESGQRLFWINGKAGSGKSTLMKYIYQSKRTVFHLTKWASDKQLVFIPYFFWHAGTALQKSYEGILRSLLLQILNKRADLAQVLFPKTFMHLLDQQNKVSHQFVMAELQEAIDILTTQLPQDMALFIMIDGIDEYSGDYFEFCKFLVRLSNSPGIKVLVSSRPIPSCHHFFSRFPSIRVQDLTVTDIEYYIEEELVTDDLLQEMNTLYPGFSDQVIKELTSKASGVFLWIILVVKDLLIGLENYDKPDTLMHKINRLPSDLEDLYDHMFARMSPEYQQEGSMLLQLTKRALEIQGPTYTAVQSSFADPAFAQYRLQDDSLKSKEIREARIKAVDGRLRSRCCGLVEVQYKHAGGVKEPRVNFLHRTVAEYLSEYGVWEKLKELKNWSQAEIDMTLLRSCSQTLHRSSFVLLDDGTVPSDLQTLFRACFEYSRLLSKTGSDDYVDHLYAADAILRRFSKTHSLNYEADEIYGNFYDALHQETDELGFREYSFEEVVEGRLLYMLLFTATCDVPTFWRHRLRDISKVAREKLLLDILETVRRTVRHNEGSDLERYLINLEALLEDTSPNTPIMDKHLYWRERAVLLKKNRTDNSCTITPWHYWLTVRIETRGFDKFTLLLMRAGAELTSDHGPTQKALQTLLSDAKLLKGKLAPNSTEETSTFDEIISRLEGAQQQSQTSRAVSPNPLVSGISRVRNSLFKPFKR